MEKTRVSRLLEKEIEANLEKDRGLKSQANVGLIQKFKIKKSGDKQLKQLAPPTVAAEELSSSGCSTYTEKSEGEEEGSLLDQAQFIVGINDHRVKHGMPEFHIIFDNDHEIWAEAANVFVDEPSLCERYIRGNIEGGDDLWHFQRKKEPEKSTTTKKTSTTTKKKAPKEVQKAPAKKKKAATKPTKKKKAAPEKKGRYEDTKYIKRLDGHRVHKKQPQLRVVFDNDYVMWCDASIVLIDEKTKVQNYIKKAKLQQKKGWADVWASTKGNL